MDIATLAGSGVVASLLISLVRYLVGKVEGRWGKLWTQLLVLAVCFVVASMGVLIKILPPEIINTTLSVWASAVLIYQLAYKAVWEDGIKKVE